jgi:hypothetical protein
MYPTSTHQFTSLVPRPSLDLPAFNVAFVCNIKSWEIERGPVDEAANLHVCQLANYLYMGMSIDDYVQVHTVNVSMLYMILYI